MREESFEKEAQLVRRALAQRLQPPALDQHLLIEDANDHILRALSQLAGFGLIAQVSVPNQQSEYVVGYRRFREEERILPVDLQATLES